MDSWHIVKKIKKERTNKCYWCLQKDSEGERYHRFREQQDRNLKFGVCIKIAPCPKTDCFIWTFCVVNFEAMCICFNNVGAFVEHLHLP